MRKVIAIGAMLAPLWLAGCADDGETTVVQPPAQQGSTVIVPERDDADRTVVVPETRKSPTVLVPSYDGGMTICPAGETC